MTPKKDAQAMSEIVKIPGSFIRLPVIQDRFQEDICHDCEVFILDCGVGGSNTQFFQCEGCRCDQANEFFEDTHDELDYIFYYYESKEVKDAIKELDNKIDKIGSSLNFHFYKLEVFNAVLSNKENRII